MIGSLHRTALRAMLTLGTALALAAPAAAAPFEPNDTFGQAYGPVVGGADQTATIENAADKDFYFFYTNGQRQLDVSLTLTSSGGCQLSLTTFDHGGNEVPNGYAAAQWYGASDPPQVGHALFTSPGRREYVLKVQNLYSYSPVGCTYKLKVSPADAITTESPGLTMFFGITDSDAIQRVYVDGQLKGQATGRDGGSVSLGHPAPTAQIVFETQNTTGPWGWNATLTNVDARTSTTLWSEKQSGGDSSSAPVRIGIVRRVALSQSGAVLDGCGEVVAAATCFPRDTDGDGITDSADQCSSVAGVAPTGCPDKDGDGIQDKDDGCPAAAGVVSAAGCPDADGDGIADASDQCKKLVGPGPSGCPPKQRFASVLTVQRRGATYRGRVTSIDVGCMGKRRVVLRRSGSGKRSFGSATTNADGTYAVRLGRRLRGRVYVVVSQRDSKTKLCRVGSSKAIRG